MIEITMQTVIAWHEAGHAVIARALGVPIEFVSIKGTRPTTRYARQRSAEEGVWTTLAAAVTVMEFTGNKELADYGAEGDFEALGAFLRSLPTTAEQDLVVRQAEESLPRLIKANKTAVRKWRKNFSKSANLEVMSLTDF